MIKMKDKCIFLDEWNNCDISEKLIKTKKDIHGKPRKHLLNMEDISCKFYKDCYYKQKEKYKNALKEIREIAEPYCNYCEEKNINRKNCKNCEHSEYKKIINIINEVLNA